MFIPCCLISSLSSFRRIRDKQAYIAGCMHALIDKMLSACFYFCVLPCIFVICRHANMRLSKQSLSAAIWNRNSQRSFLLLPRVFSNKYWSSPERLKASLLNYFCLRATLSHLVTHLRFTFSSYRSDLKAGTALRIAARTRSAEFVDFCEIESSIGTKSFSMNCSLESFLSFTALPSLSRIVAIFS